MCPQAFWDDMRQSLRAMPEAGDGSRKQASRDLPLKLASAAADHKHRHFALRQARTVQEKQESGRLRPALAPRPLPSARDLGRGRLLRGSSCSSYDKPPAA